MKAFNWSTYHKEYRERNKEKLNERMRLYMQKKRDKQNGFIYCTCCGEKTKNAPNKLYCASCKKLVKNILRRHKVDIDISINYSDNMYTTDLCDQKCDICKYEKCILPED